MLIFYTGIGCNHTEKHSVPEFLDIMNREFTNKNWSRDFLLIPRKQHYQLQFKDWVLPEDFTFFTLADWIEYSGAEVISEHETVKAQYNI